MVAHTEEDSCRQDNSRHETIQNVIPRIKDYGPRYPPKKRILRHYKETHPSDSESGERSPKKAKKVSISSERSSARSPLSVKTQISTSYPAEAGDGGSSTISREKCVTKSPSREEIQTSNDYSLRETTTLQSSQLKQSSGRKSPLRKTQSTSISSYRKVEGNTPSTSSKLLIRNWLIDEDTPIPSSSVAESEGATTLLRPKRIPSVTQSSLGEEPQTSKDPLKDFSEVAVTTRSKPTRSSTKSTLNRQTSKTPLEGVSTENPSTASNETITTVSPLCEKAQTLNDPLKEFAEVTSITRLKPTKSSTKSTLNRQSSKNSREDVNKEKPSIVSKESITTISPWREKAQTLKDPLKDFSEVAVTTRSKQTRSSTKSTLSRQSSKTPLEGVSTEKPSTASNETINTVSPLCEKAQTLKDPIKEFAEVTSTTRSKQTKSSTKSTLNRQSSKSSLDGANKGKLSIGSKESITTMSPVREEAQTLNDPLQDFSEVVVTTRSKPMKSSTKSTLNRQSSKTPLEGVSTENPSTACNETITAVSALCEKAQTLKDPLKEYPEVTSTTRSKQTKSSTKSTLNGQSSKSSFDGANKGKLSIGSKETITTISPLREKAQISNNVVGELEEETAPRGSKRKQKKVTKSSLSVNAQTSIRSPKESVEKSSSKSLRHKKSAGKENSTVTPESNEDNMRFQCKKCKEKFSQIGSLKAHLLVHKKEKPFICNECKKTFSSKAQLASHIKTHSGEKPYSCDKCSKSFSLKGNLKAHIKRHIGEKYFVCIECDMRFVQRSHLYSHLRTHSGEKPYACGECNKSFAVKSDLNRHQKTHSGEKPHVCPTCGKGFSQKSNLASHLRTHNGYGIKHFVCIECDMRFPEMHDLYVHIRTHTKEQPYACSVCDKRFSQKGNLDTHKRTHSGQKPFQCSECNKSFTQKASLQVHLRSHSGEKPYGCKVCGKKFSIRGNLDKHMGRHSDREISIRSGHQSSRARDSSNTNLDLDKHPEHQSKRSGDSSKTIADLENQERQHRGREDPIGSEHRNGRLGHLSDAELNGNEQPQSENTHSVGGERLTRIIGGSSNTNLNLDELRLNGDEEQSGELIRIRARRSSSPNNLRDFGCKDCDKRFTSIEDVKIHLKTHEKPKSFVCHECNKKFATKLSLNVHQKIHSGERPHGCTECDLKFSRKCDLQKHLRRHSGIKPFVCAECDARFFEMKDLYNHLPKHTNNWPYRCIDCKKRFAQKCDFNDHQRTHTGEKPHICTTCDKRFSRVSNLKTHLKTHGGEKPYVCTTCKKLFLLKCNLEKHLETHKEKIYKEKNLACHVCDKAFANKVQLYQHLDTHFGDKQFQCSECDKKFLRKVYLTRHLRTHSGEKPYMCYECNQLFSRRKQLVRHLKVHSEEGLIK